MFVPFQRRPVTNLRNPAVRGATKGTLAGINSFAGDAPRRGNGTKNRMQRAYRPLSFKLNDESLLVYCLVLYRLVLY
eukprot:scaffold252571_cov20-Prasinocladus_malaysianus.AAC.1